MRGLRLLIILASAASVAFAACGQDTEYAQSSTDASAGSDPPPSGNVVAEDAGWPSDGGADVDANPPIVIPTRCNGSVRTSAPPWQGPPPGTLPTFTIPAGFKLDAIGLLGPARSLVALPNGDLLVTLADTRVFIIPHAEEDVPSDATVFATSQDSPLMGLTYDPTTCTLYFAGQLGIYTAPYVDGQMTATLSDPIANVRIDTPNAGHVSTSLAFAESTLYASVGSSCNACTETDPTRATVLRMNPDGSDMAQRGARIRNAIAIARNPATGTVWIGNAGQDGLPEGHPLEWFDPLTVHAGVPDYGWPDCEENHVAYTPDADCSNVVVPRVEFPAYSTLIGAVFYPLNQTGKYAFPVNYRGGAYVTAHGSWHTDEAGAFSAAPRIAFVPMNGDTPAAPVSWNDPTAQWSDFVSGFEVDDGMARVARPTGIAIGPQGTMFFADDDGGYVYRIRPQ